MWWRINHKKHKKTHITAYKYGFSINDRMLRLAEYHVNGNIFYIYFIESEAYGAYLQWFVTLKVACKQTTPDSKVHGANMGLAWVMSAPDGPHVVTMNLAIRDRSVVWNLKISLLPAHHWFWWLLPDYPSLLWSIFHRGVSVGSTQLCCIVDGLHFGRGDRGKPGWPQSCVSGCLTAGPGRLGYEACD